MARPPSSLAWISAPNITATGMRARSGMSGHGMQQGTRCSLVAVRDGLSSTRGGLVLAGIVIIAVTAGIYSAVRSTTPRMPPPTESNSEAARFWTAAAEDPVEVVGGGSILATVTATWPFAVLQYGRAGIGLRMRGFAVGSSSAFKWSQVISVERAPRSLVVRAVQSRSFRFMVFDSAELDPVVREAEAHGVTV